MTSCEAHDQADAYNEDNTHRCDKCGGFLRVELVGGSIKQLPCRKCGHQNLTMRQRLGRGGEE